MYTLRRQLDSERELERMRRRLALHPSFNLLSAFHHFDTTRTGYITASELDHVLIKSGGVRLTPIELRQLVRLFDRDGDGRISYSDFIRKLMPKDDRYCDLVTNTTTAASASKSASPIKKPAAYTTFSGSPTKSFSGSGGGPVAVSAHGRPRALSGGAARELALTLKRHIDLETELDTIRSAFCARPDFSLHTALSAIDRDGTGQIAIHEFRRFLIDHGVVPSGSTATGQLIPTSTAEGELELSALLSRYDKTNSGSISYLDFLDELVLPSYVSKPTTSGGSAAAK